MSARTRIAHALARRGPRALLATLLLGSAGTAAAASVYTDWISSGAEKAYSVEVGVADNQIVVRGNHLSDQLSCWVYQDGDEVDHDTDQSPVCVLNTPGVGTHHLYVHNYGAGTTVRVRQR